MQFYTPKYPRGTRIRFLLSRSLLLFLVFTLSGAGSLSAAYRCSGDCAPDIQHVEPPASMPCCASTEPPPLAQDGPRGSDLDGSESCCPGHLVCPVATLNGSQDMLVAASAPEPAGQMVLSLPLDSANPAVSADSVLLLSSYRRPPPSNLAPLHLRHCVFLI
jgi:hypothetical protein